MDEERAQSGDGSQASRSVARSEFEAAAWGRAVISVRLSGRRKAMLRRIAAELGGDATPSASIDAAIERAMDAPFASQAPLADRLDHLEETIVAAARDMRADGLRRDAHAEEAARSASSVLALISAAAGNQSGTADDSQADRAMPATDWIKDVVEASAPPLSSAIARGRWVGLRRAASNSAQIEFELAVVALDGQPISGARREPARVGFEPIEMDGDTFKAIAANAASPMLVALRRTDSKWRASLFAVIDAAARPQPLGALPC